MRSVPVVVVALAAVSPVLAHHSDAGLDTDSIVMLEGTVTEFRWRNPHIYFTMDVPDASGDTVEWQVQMGSTSVSLRRGWTEDALAPGDRVTVKAHPGRNGRPYALLVSLEVEGGAVLADRSDAPEITAKASTLEGVWMANAAELVSYPGGFDGFFRVELEPTARGAAAMAGYDEFSEDNPESRCVGRPTPGMIISSNLFPMQIELDEGRQIVFIRSEIWDEERTVYMDGRPHPDVDTRFPSGHSIGWWDGDTLVVDTTNFADHRSPYQIGLPSGGQKHVVERYRLKEDGTRLIVQFVLEDPEYIAEPLVHARELVYAPQIQLQRFDCDPRSTRQFLP